jgi:hypothetical protein
MRSNAGCGSRDCQYCECGRSRWFAQEQAEDGHPLAVLLSEKAANARRPSQVKKENNNDKNTIDN